MLWYCNVIVCMFSDWREDLRRLQETVDCNTTPPANLINVVRTDILACFSRALMRKNFRPLQKLDIRFVDSAGMSEMAIDQGGPAREFFMLLLREITSDVVFEGPDMRKQLSLSTNGEFFGVLINNYCIARNSA